MKVQKKRLDIEAFIRNNPRSTVLFNTQADRIWDCLESIESLAKDFDYLRMDDVISRFEAEVPSWDGCLFVDDILDRMDKLEGRTDRFTKFQ
jgi:hypothetical protein